MNGTSSIQEIEFEEVSGNFAKIEAKIEEWLSLPNTFIKIRKPTQVGVTTSLIKVARRKRLSVAVLEPTNKIIDDTVVKQFNSHKTKVAKIGRNQFMCPNSKVDPVFGWDTRGNCN
ncbi:MAG: hypothetical protein ACXQTM_05045, partial [Methanosarcinales archaeon]